MILGGHVKSWKSDGKFFWGKSVGTCYLLIYLFNYLLNVRCMYMDHMYDRLCKKGAVMEVGGDGLFDGHKVALRLMQVEAASTQGNCSLALRLLKTTHDVSNCD